MVPFSYLRSQIETLKRLKDSALAHIKAVALAVSSVHLLQKACTLLQEVTEQIANVNIYQQDYRSLCENEIVLVLASVVQRLNDQADEMMPQKTIERLIDEFQDNRLELWQILLLVRQKEEINRKSQTKARKIFFFGVILAAGAAYVYHKSREETLELMVATEVFSLSTVVISLYNFVVLKEEKQSLNSLHEKIINCREMLSISKRNLISCLSGLNPNPNSHELLEVVSKWLREQNA